MKDGGRSKTFTTLIDGIRKHELLIREGGPLCPLSVVLQDLEDWQVKYIEYATQELDRNVLLTIIREVHNAG